MNGDEFSVVIFFPDGYYEYVCRYVSAQKAVETAASYTRRPAAQMGIIRRVIVTDGDDHCNFEWKFGEGVTYPPEAKGRT
jgi:hypothetical protein